jgi:ankyrin repeat protein
VGTLQILAVAGIDCNCADYDARSALHLAASNGCMDATKFMLALKGINVCSVLDVECSFAMHASPNLVMQ